MIELQITPIDRIGTYAVSCPGLGLRIERTKFPLLDACRELKRMGADPRGRVGLFREGKVDPDLISTVGYAAELRVREDGPDGPRFEKYRLHPNQQEESYVSTKLQNTC